MSIPYSGIRSRSNGLISAIAKQLRTLNLKCVKKITVQFDPFHDKSYETREFLFQVTTPKIISTNPMCMVKTNIVQDRSEPTVLFDLASGDKVLFKCTNLTALDILKYCNKHITSLVPPDPEVEARRAEEQLKKQRKGYLKIKPFSKRRGVFL